MKARLLCALAVVVAFGAVFQARSAATAPRSDREKFIGAWHLVSLEAPGADGKMVSVPGLTGTLIYTRDGHMSVEIMYPESAAALSNDYVLNGYEASFGSYEVDEAKHTVTHHVQGSVTRALVGKSLVRAYRFTDDGRLIITSARPDEHWSAAWEHY
ncbi:MAG: lipocalin-like domain-containing protein [Acidobacteriaceae bacterium]